ncbi:MAG: alanine racemase, partial [Planctomycetes bacterium]|nr:alanine racemase [Planctomycetota bacterium]
MESRLERALLGRLDAEALVQRFGTPLWVYDELTATDRARAVAEMAAELELDVRYALKANPCPELLELFNGQGFGVDAVSIGEVEAARSAGLPAERISFTGNNVSADEMRRVHEAGVEITVDSRSQLATFGRVAPGSTVAIRINPRVEAGHHPHVITGGPDSKFGIDPADLSEVLDLARRHDLTIHGLHQHLGSGILDHELFLKVMDLLLEQAPRFPDLQFIDFGGGFGIPYRPDEFPFDLAAFSKAAKLRLKAFRKDYRRPVAWRVQPGRLLVAECGLFLVRVTSVERGRRHT